MPRKRDEVILIGSPDRQLNASLKKIRKYRPFKLLTILKMAEDRVGKDGNVDGAIVSIIREKTHDQLMSTLRALSIDPDAPHAWEKGFVRLAYQVYGVGRFAW